MTRKTFILLLCATLLCASACNRIEQPSGSVALSFNVGDPATRAESVGDGNAADGGGIYCAKDGSVVKPDLLIFIADESGSIIKSYDGWDDTVDDGTLGEDNYDSTTHSATRLTVSFLFNQTGTFYVYGIANTRGTGDNYNLVIPALSSISTVSDLTDKILTLTSAALTNNKTPDTGDNSVKISGVTADKVSLKFGDDGSEQYAALTSIGAFADTTSEKIFEVQGKGILAAL